MAQLVSYPEIPAKQLYFEKPRIDNFLRISVGTGEEMAHLVKANSGILQGEMA